MKTAKIPAEVSIKAGPYKGTFAKRPGSRRDTTLFCWFDSQNRANVPHISLNISFDHEDWNEFHATFNVLKAEAWSEEMATVGYHVYFKIKDDTVSIKTSDDTRSWRRAKPGERIIEMEFADMQRQGLLFAKEFYAAAFAQMVD